MSKKTSEWEDEFMDKFAVMLERYTAAYSPKYAEEMIDEVLAFISDLLAKEKMELVKKIEKMIYDPDWDRDRSVVGILRYLEALKSEIQEEVGG